MIELRQEVRLIGVVMANTYTQLYVHVVFAVKGRLGLIRKQWKEELHKYIAGIVRNQGQKLIGINSMPDHVHVLLGLRPDIALSELVRDIKANSSRFVNERRWVRGKFNWQEGFGAFTRSHEELERVIKYIENQEAHHSRKCFLDEYLQMLQDSHIEFDKKYVFEQTD
ncbi:MAG: IS200/IS605 family transposase [Ignavibacteriales bacterium]|nr:IS200/IS605 family transposase [Ignavibacteriales bacterium]